MQTLLDFLQNHELSSFDVEIPDRSVTHSVRFIKEKSQFEKCDEIYYQMRYDSSKSCHCQGFNFIGFYIWGSDKIFTNGSLSSDIRKWIKSKFWDVAMIDTVESIYPIFVKDVMEVLREQISSHHVNLSTKKYKDKSIWGIVLAKYKHTDEAFIDTAFDLLLANNPKEAVDNYIEIELKESLERRNFLFNGDNYCSYRLMFLLMMYIRPNGGKKFVKKQINPKVGTVKTIIDRCAFLLAMVEHIESDAAEIQKILTSYSPGELMIYVRKPYCRSTIVSFNLKEEFEATFGSKIPLCCFPKNKDRARYRNHAPQKARFVSSKLNRDDQYVDFRRIKFITVKETKELLFHRGKLHKYSFD